MSKSSGAHETSRAGRAAAARDNKIAAVFAGVAEPAKRGGAREGAGRKPTPEADALRVGSIRLTQAQWDKLALLGGAAWLRERIEKARLPDKP